MRSPSPQLIPPDCTGEPEQPRLECPHQATVERVIEYMRAHYSGPLSLGDMADLAHLSPFHFNRVFRSVTGLPPYRFQTAIRLAVAKQLLLTSQESITDVCFEVGYKSLSTFTNHFTRQVGVSPYHLRRLADELTPREIAASALHKTVLPALLAHPDGQIQAEGQFDGMIFIGLFELARPQTRPVACTLQIGLGHYRLPPAPDGRYYVFAAGMAHSNDLLHYLLPDHQSLFVGMAGSQQPSAVRMRAGKASTSIDITLRRLRPTDPPLLLALPLLLREHQGLYPSHLS